MWSPSFYRCVAQSRVCSRLVFARTPAVHFTPCISHVKVVTPDQVVAISSDCLQFVRSLSVSCPVRFHVTKMNCDVSEHDNKASFSTANDSTTESKVSQAQRLKRAVKEYGSTVIVFHVCISLFTLGVSYAAVSRWSLTLFNIRKR